jgi:CheY-like chemotaxis protein
MPDLIIMEAFMGKSSGIDVLRKIRRDAAITNTPVILISVFASAAVVARAMDVGLRYDLQYLETIETDTSNVSPRVGVAWSPSASGRWVVRASAGRFYDRVPLRALANALLSAGNTTDVGSLRQISVSLSPTQTGAPVFPNILADVVPTTTLVNLTTMDRALQNAYSDQVAFEFERQVGATASVSASYHRLRGRHLLMSINQNVPTCPATGGNNGCRPNPAYANHNQYSSVGSSEYDGLHLSLVQRPVRWGAYRVSYAYSKSMNNLGEAFFSSPYDPADLSRDWARSDDDQRHRLTMNGTLLVSFAAPSGWWQRAADGLHIGAVIQYYSALPFNITTGTTTVQGTQARPIVDGVVISRNAGEGTPFATVGLRVGRQLPLGGRATADLLVEVFNLFNRRNDLARSSVFGTGAYPTSPSPTFGNVTAVGDPRAIQLGLRVRF